MRLPDTEFTSRPWRLHEFIDDFTVDDVWALPTPGGPDDLDRLVQQRAADTDLKANLVFRTLWSARWKLGALLGWDKPEKDAGKRTQSVRDRLSKDLLAVRGPDMSASPMKAVYQTHDEYVTEFCNSTVHGLMHIGWVEDEKGGYYAQMTSLVKPNGLFGKAYLLGIRPLRHWLVYPALLQMIDREWQALNAK